MIAVFINLIIILVLMKVFFKFMYPKPPKHFMPTPDDDTSLRKCHHCGHELATYRGILEQVEGEERFFCNQEHQTAFLQNHT